MGTGAQLCTLLLVLVVQLVIAVPVPPAKLIDQVYNWPQVTPPSTPGVLPSFGVQLQPGAQNIVDLTFGTDVEGSTIQNVNQLGNVAYFYDIFGDPSNTRSSPTDGIPQNFLGKYSFYNEFLDDNVTRNPLALHQVLEDRLRLVARTAMNGSAPGAQYEIGYIRLPTQFQPGMTAEIRLAPGGWPTCRWSWPTFWAFTSIQFTGSLENDTRWFAMEALENDGFDGFPPDNSTQGKSMNNGTPVYGPTADYSYPDEIYMQTLGNFRYEADNRDRVDLMPNVDPTNSSNPGLTVIMEWTDINTMKYWYNGELVRIHHCHMPSVISNETEAYSSTPPPPDKVGEPMPMFIIVSHQFGVLFNPIDIAALKAYNGSIVANYDVLSIRIWDQPTIGSPATSYPDPGPLPPPQKGPALGDLPQISSGTYVVNVEVVNDTLVDHFGSNVSLIGDATIGPKPLNGRPAVLTSSVWGKLGAISVQGPVLYYAQNGGNFAIFQAAFNLNPFMNPTTYAQFVRAYPATPENYDKPTLIASNGVLSALLASSYTSDVASASTPTKIIQVSSKPDLVSYTQALAQDGTVVVGVGFGNSTQITPASGKGVPSELLGGYTELVLGSGRDNYGQLTFGAPLIIGQTVVVAIPPGSSLSAEDRASIENYLTEKWGCNLAPPYTSQAPTTPQISQLSPPSDSTFLSVNSDTLSVSGGGSSPLVLAQPPQKTHNVAMKLLSLGNGPLMFTTFVNLTLPYVTDTNAGVAFYNNQSNVISTFGIHYRNLMAGSFQFNKFNSPNLYNASLDKEVRTWFNSAGREVWMRVAINSTSFSLLASQTGRENTWSVLFTYPPSLALPTHLGFYVDAYSDSPSLSLPVSLAINHLDLLSSFSDIQQAAGPYLSSTSPLPPPPSSIFIPHGRVKIN